MKTSQLAKELNLPMPECRLLLKELGLDPESNEILDENAEQIINKRNEVVAAQHQLSGDTEQQPDPAPEPTKKRRGKLAKNEPSELKVATAAGLQQQKLSQAIAASTELKAHILNTRLQASFGRGQEIGAVEALVEEHGRVSGYLAVIQTSFTVEMSHQQKQLADILNQLEETDFFGQFQTAPESYLKATQEGATSNSELAKILQNLAAS